MDEIQLFYSVISNLKYSSQIIQLNHWNTHDLMAHELYGEIYECLEDILDNIVEAFPTVQRVSPAYLEKMQYEVIPNSYRIMQHLVDVFTTAANHYSKNEFDGQYRGVVNILDDAIKQFGTFNYKLRRIHHD